MTCAEAELTLDLRLLISTQCIVPSFVDRCNFSFNTLCFVPGSSQGQDTHVPRSVLIVLNCVKLTNLSSLNLKNRIACFKKHCIVYFYCCVMAMFSKGWFKDTKDIFQYI